MAKTSRLKNRVWPKLGAIAIIGIWFVSAAANFDAGLALSNDAGTSFVLGIASVCVDVLKAVMLFIMAMAAYHRRPLVVGVGLVCFLLCGAWSMRSAAQFILSTFSNHEARAEVALAVQQSELSLLDLRTKRAGFLSEQVTTVQGNKSARADALAANQGSAKEFAALVKDIEGQQKSLKTRDVVGSVDPIAETFHIDPTTLHKIYAGIFALILEIISGFGFWLMAMSRTPREVTIQPSAAPALIHRADDSAPASMPEPIPLNIPPSTNVIPLRRVLGPMTPEPPQIKEIKEVIGATPYEASASEIKDAALKVFESGAADRKVLWGSVRELINEHLPIHKAIGERSTTLLPALTELFPGAHKLKRGGQMYIYGIQQKHREAERA